MLRRPKHSTIEVVAPKEEEEVGYTGKMWYSIKVHSINTVLL